MQNKKVIVIIIFTAIILIAIASLFFKQHIQIENDVKVQKSKVGEVIRLPEPRYLGDTSIEEALFKRRSIREYSGDNLTIEEISQLLWSAQGITSDSGRRTAPSAGALYPLELYLVVGDVEDLDQGVYRYRPKKHDLVKVLDVDIRKNLSEAALGQKCVQDGAIDIVFSAVYRKTTSKYQDRGIRYVHMEVGHAAQNVYLMSVSLDLGAVVLGAFDDNRVKEIMKIDEDPLYIMPIGRKNRR